MDLTSDEDTPMEALSEELELDELEDEEEEDVESFLDRFFLLFLLFLDLDLSFSLRFFSFSFNSSSAFSWANLQSISIIIDQVFYFIIILRQGFILCTYLFRSKLLPSLKSLLKPNASFNLAFFSFCAWANWWESLTIGFPKSSTSLNAFFSCSTPKI